ncbi:MAG: hypothetical protein WBC70_14240 [Candidatus Aminicenantales bacterium]
MMPENSNNQGLLSSWKEISSYLLCDERTCRRWELSRGLPVHRMEGSSKSRVFAYRDELDAWRKERLNGAENKNGREAGAPKPVRTGAAKKWLWLFPVLAVISAAAVFLLRSSPGQPADFRIQGSKLAILDKEGAVLWTFDTGLPNLETEKTYRERFQVVTNAPQGVRRFYPYLIMRDIDSDGKTEVIFCTKSKHDQAQGELFCFDARGEKKWHHKAGREVEFGGRTYSNDFRIVGFRSMQEPLLFILNSTQNSAFRTSRAAITSAISTASSKRPAK